MSPSMTLTLIYSLALLFWVAIIVLVIRVVKNSKGYSKRIIPLTIIFFLVSAIIIGISFYFFMRAQQEMISPLSPASFSTPY